MHPMSQFLQSSTIIIIIFITTRPLINCVFTDKIESHTMGHEISSVRAQHINDNTSIISNIKHDNRQTFIPSNFASNHLSAALANIANFGNFGTMATSMGNLRTVMMGGMLYGLSLIPAVVLALSGNGLPMGGILSSLGLSKRAVSETSSAKMPLLSEDQTKKLLQMLQLAFKQWNVADETCKQLFVCQMYKQVSSDGVNPDLELFKEALLNTMERGGQNRVGRAAEALLAQYEHYFVAARMGMKQETCEFHYPTCKLSLYFANDGSSKGTKPSKVKAREEPVNEKSTV